jgi:hypothetical protein
MAASRPSFPAPSEPNLKRLGAGGGGPDRPLRAQLVVGVVVVCLLVAVPLYIWRRPNGAEPEPTEASTPKKARQVVRDGLDASTPKIKVRLGQVQRLQCSASPTVRGNEGNLCDALPQVEKSLLAAIAKNSGCAPKTGKGGTINFVLTLDFTQKRLNVFPGASGQWKGPQAKAAATCVENAIADLAWDSVEHRYRYYVLAVMATYPAPAATDGLPDFE